MDTHKYHDLTPIALIVDDDPLGLITTSEILARIGIQSDITASPKEALSKVSENRYDYVVLDIEMPALNGYQLASEIRNGDNKSKNAFIVALSGRLYDKKHVTQCLKAGMCDVLAKPLTQQKLQQRMSYWHFAMRNADKLSSGS